MITTLKIQEHPELNELNAEYKVRKMTRNRPNKKGLVKIEIEIPKYWYGGTGQYNRERIKVDSRIWVHSSNWNTVTKIGSAIERFVSSKGVQELDQPYVENLDLANLRELFPNRKNNRKTLADWIDVEYRRRKTDLEDVSILWADEFYIWEIRFGIWQQAFSEKA